MISTTAGYCTRGPSTVPYVLLCADHAPFLIRLPKHLDNVPVLILDCNEEFENDGVNREKMLKQVCRGVRERMSEVWEEC